MSTPLRGTSRQTDSSLFRLGSGADGRGAAPNGAHTIRSGATPHSATSAGAEPAEHDHPIGGPQRRAAQQRIQAGQTLPWRRARQTSWP